MARPTYYAIQLSCLHVNEFTTILASLSFQERLSVRLMAVLDAALAAISPKNSARALASAFADAMASSATLIGALINLIYLSSTNTISRYCIAIVFASSTAEYNKLRLMDTLTSRHCNSATRMAFCTLSLVCEAMLNACTRQSSVVLRRESG